MFRKWLAEANRVGVSEAYSFIIGSIDAENRPMGRVVVLKECDELGFVFGSSGKSPKVRHFELNPHASGTFWWHETIQQVLFTGCVSILDPNISDKLFADRQRDARAISTLSHQSEPLVDEFMLRNELSELIASQDPIKRPDYWHAYRIVPDFIEFWQGNPDRFHRRLRYDRNHDGWTYQRLQP